MCPHVLGVLEIFVTDVELLEQPLYVHSDGRSGRPSRAMAVSSALETQATALARTDARIPHRRHRGQSSAVVLSAASALPRAAARAVMVLRLPGDIVRILHDQIFVFTDNAHVESRCWWLGPVSEPGLVTQVLVLDHIATEDHRRTSGV